MRRSELARGRTSRRSTATTFAALGLTALLAACSGSASSAASAGTSASSQQSSSSSGASAAKPAGDLKELAERMSAAAKAKSTAQVALTTGSVATMNGAIRYRGNAADMSVTTNAGGQQIKLVLVDGVAYVSTGQRIQGKSWAKISGTGKDPLSRALGPVLTTLGTSMDVSQQLAKEPDAKIVSSSSTQLGGVPVTKYTVSVSERDLLAQLSGFGLTDTQRAQLEAQFKGAHGESVLYVDGADLMRRAENKVVGGKAPSTQSVVTYSHWGDPVDISAPPTSDTIDASALG
jgi:hypothetical protein